MSNTNTNKTAAYFKGSNSAKCTLLGTAKADSIYNEKANLTVVTIVTREEYTGRDGQPAELLREVPLYLTGADFTARAGDVILVTGALHLAEAKGGNAKYPTLFERIMPSKVENLGAAKTNGLNQAVITGFVGSTRELKGKQPGLAVTVAVTRVQGGQEKTDWHESLFWGKRAENAGKLLSKGTLVSISGVLANRTVKVGETSKVLLGFMPTEFAILHKKDGAAPAKSQPAESGQEEAGTAFEDDGSGIPF